MRRKHDYTNAERQAKRRARFRRMRDALDRIIFDAASLDEARALAEEGVKDPPKPTVLGDLTGGTIG